MKITRTAADMWVGGLALAALMLFVLWATGCATALPPCEKFKYMFGEDQSGEPVFAMDTANALKLGALIRGLSEGTCRLQPEGET